MLVFFFNFRVDLVYIKWSYNFNLLLILDEFFAAVGIYNLVSPDVSTSTHATTRVAVKKADTIQVEINELDNVKDCGRNNYLCPG